MTGIRFRASQLSLSVTGILAVVLVIGTAWVPQQLRADMASRIVGLTQYFDATVAGACVTILKAWFDESFVLPDPVVASADGSALLPYSGRDAGSLTVGGELNKLAANIPAGRNFAGIHWRTDFSEALKLGEAVAIGILQDQKNTYKESFDGFSLTKFDGTTITV